MSYNVRDLLDDRAAAARVVRAVDPDVLCLQEVPRRLTMELRLPAFARQCGLYWGGGRLGTGGTAVLTALRTRVHGAARGRLPVRFPDRTRGYAAVTVSLPGLPRVTVASVHLGLEAGERERHARAVLDALGMSVDPSAPTFVPVHDHSGRRQRRRQAGENQGIPHDQADTQARRQSA